MAEQVEYTLSLKETVTAKLEAMASASEKLEGSITSLQYKINSLSSSVSGITALANAYRDLASAMKTAGGAKISNVNTSGGLNRFGRPYTTQRTNGGVGQSYSYSYAGGGRESDPIAKARAEVRARNRQEQQGWNRADAIERGMKPKVSSSGRGGFFGMGSSTNIGSIVGAGIAGYGAYQAFDFAKEVVTTTAEYERMARAIKLSSDNAGQAELSMSWIKNMSRDFGLPIKETTEGFKMWQGAVMGTNMTSTKARDVFGKFAKSFAALGLDADRSKLAFMAIGQMMSKGKISAEELTQQLSEHLPGATKMLAKSLGITNEQLYKMMKAGKVLSEETLPKLADTMYNSIGKGAADNVDTLTGKINLMANAWENMKLAMGKSQGGFWGGVMDVTTKVIDDTGMLFRSPEQVFKEDFGSDTAQRWLGGLEPMYLKKIKKLKSEGKSYGEVGSIIDKDIEERKSKLERAGLTAEREFLGGKYRDAYGHKFQGFENAQPGSFEENYNKKNEAAKKHAELVQALYKTAAALDSEKLLNQVFKPSTSGGGGVDSSGMPKVGGSLSEKKVTHINIEVGTLVEMILNGVNAKEVVDAVKREVPKALLTVLNDANIIMTQNQR